MSSQSVKRTSIIALVLNAAIISGYALTQHNAFLFVYGLISWVSFAALGFMLWLAWWLLTSHDDAVSNAAVKALLEARKTMLDNKLLSWVSRISMLIIIVLLLYWEKFWVATPTILTVGLSLTFQHILFNVVKDPNAQE